MFSAARATRSLLANAIRDGAGSSRLHSPVESTRTIMVTLCEMSPTNPSSSEGGESESEPVGQGEERHPDAEKEPLPEWSDGVNPHTGEKGGPKGPEPTRYGDWERKGRVSDF